MYLLNIRRKHVAGGTITRKSIATASVTFPRNSYSYTGEAITPSASVRLDGALLSVNEDYTVAYVNNTNVGLATVVITGKGDFYGTATGEFYITAAASGWDDFEFTNLGEEVASVGLKDIRAVYENNKNLDTYNLQVLPDGRLHFGAQLQGHAYIWAFESGHPFEVEYLKSLYVDGSTTVTSGNSRSGAVMSFGSSIIYNNGLSGYYSFIGYNNIVPFTLSTAYDLSTRQAGSQISFSGGYAMCMSLSSDGGKFFHKQRDGAVLYCRTLHTPFDISAFSESEVVNVNLNTITGESLTWRGFYFSPNGLNMVATANSGGGAGSVHKFTLSEAWNITTLSRTSQKQLFDSGASPTAVVVNGSGTKMIVFNRGADNVGGTTNNYKFHEYNLTA